MNDANEDGWADRAVLTPRLGRDRVRITPRALSCSMQGRSTCVSPNGVGVCLAGQEPIERHRSMCTLYTFVRGFVKSERLRNCYKFRDRTNLATVRCVHYTPDRPPLSNRGGYGCVTEFRNATDRDGRCVHYTPWSDPLSSWGRKFFGISKKDPLTRAFALIGP